MNYYEHHLGDFARDAGHLSMVEEGAYRRLLDAYYGRESPLPLDLSQCKKLARVSRAPAEHRAVEYVLSQFFAKEPDGYHQKRCDEEIQRFRSKSKAGRDNANTRWNNATASNPHMQNGSERDATASNSHRVGNALQSPVSNPHLNPSLNPSLGKGGTSRQRRSERRAEQDEAAIIWDRLLATDGKDRDHRSQAALDAIGGWRAWQMRTAAESASLRKRFLEAYRTLSPVKPNGARAAERRPDPQDEIEREEAARADG